ncbi:MAG: SurA N-terminal domain-containing protein [Gammaproteobacteria bacterium]|nr:SurA N-terminal domain-containing protein [Gammaproteobacteria bacterium]
MLQILRERAQVWAARVIIFLLIVPFALWGIQEYAGTDANVSVASVNGTDIGQRDFQQAYEQEQQRLRTLLGKAFDQQRPDEARTKRAVVDRLVEDILVEQAATDAGLRVSNADLAEQIHSMPELLDNGTFSKQIYEQRLRAIGLTPAAFEKRLRHALLSEQMSNGVTTSAMVTPRELDSVIRLREQQREIGYLLLPLARFAAGAEPDAAAVSAYYRQQREQFTAPEQVSIDYIELTADELAQRITPDEQELRKFYEEQAASTKSFDEVRPQLESDVRKRKAEQQYFEKLEILTNLAYENPDSLAVAAEQLGLSVKSSALFARRGGDGIAAHPKVANAAFSDEVVVRGFNSEPIEIGDHRSVVLRMKEHKPSAVRALEEVRPAIVEQLRKEAARARIQAAGMALQARLAKGESAETVAKEHGVEWLKPGLIRRDEAKLNAVLVRAAFRLARPAPESKAAVTVGGTALESDDYAVVAVYAVRDGDPAALDAAARLQLQRELQRTHAAAEYQGYLNGLKQAAKIVLHTDKL